MMSVSNNNNNNNIDDALPEKFVRLNDPRIINGINYATENNFTGRIVNGYEKPGVCIMLKEMADALVKIQDKLDKREMNEHLYIFDAYRPQRAVDDFWNWANSDDTKMKEQYYPNFNDKCELFNGYIAKKSAHTRGGAVDLTLVVGEIDDYKFFDMGTIVDYLGKESHIDYNGIEPRQRANRLFLRNLMEANNVFRVYQNEWWHFYLQNEPYPDTYFDFPIN